jgi:ketosteroid isomerase-like protein
MNEQLVYDFMNAINDHDVQKIYILMADDHEFIDSHGNRIIGKDKMKAGWTGYFQLFPDYKIEITDLFVKEGMIAAFGFAEGTYKNKKVENQQNHWCLPASWKAIVDGNKIKLWQVYADTKIPFEIIEKNK